MLFTNDYIYHEKIDVPHYARLWIKQKLFTVI